MTTITTTKSSTGKVARSANVARSTTAVVGFLPIVFSVHSKPTFAHLAPS